MAIGQACRALVFALVWSSIQAQALVFNGELPSFPISQQPRRLNLQSGPTSRISRRGVATIQELTTEQQSYNVIVQVGQVNLRLAIDTGSADLWVVASSDKDATDVKVPTYPLDYFSSTFVVENNNATAFAFSYADGTGGTGFVARETLVFENITVPAQAFALVNSTDITLGKGQDAVSGVLGLGFSRLSRIAQSTKNVTSIMDHLVEDGDVEYPMFGLSLTQSAGTLSLGAVDSSLVQNTSLIEWHDVEPFNYVGQDVNSSRYLYWATELKSLSVNSTGIDITPQYRVVGKHPLALIDAGSNGIYGPLGAVQRLFEQFQDSRMIADGVWAVSCDTTLEMVLNFGGRNFTLKSSDYIIGEASGNPGTCLSWPIALAPSADGIDWQLGVPFLRTLYSAFSFGIDTREPPLIGLYPLSANPPTSTTSTALLSDNESATTSTISTVQTTLPNSLVTTPTYTTPPYAFNTTSMPSPGGTSGFGTRTYYPVLRPLTATAIPTVATVSTIVTTDTSGHSVTTTSRMAQSSVVLGVPNGESESAAQRLGQRSQLLAICSTAVAFIVGAFLV